MKDWLFWNLSRSKLFGLNQFWNTQFAITDRNIWKWRYVAIMDSTQLEEDAKVEIINLSILKTNEAYCRLRRAHGIEGISMGTPM